MKRIIQYITTALVAGLFTSGLALAAVENPGIEQNSVGEQTPGVSVPGVASSVAHPLDENQIRQMQQLLQDEGYADVNITGSIDENTTAAIEKFQRSEDLAVTGLPDDETLRALAPSADQQEFFGLSPEFGEKDKTYHEKEGSY